MRYATVITFRAADQGEAEEKAQRMSQEVPGSVVQTTQEAAEDTTYTPVTEAEGASIEEAAMDAYVHRGVDTP